MPDIPAIKDLIPHREPFLFVDKIVDISDQHIETELTVEENRDFFKGHYPHMPIMPGVLVSEAVFQSAALFISYNTKWADNVAEGQGEGSPVLTRIKMAKFKHMVKPGDTLNIKADLNEAISNAWYMKGKVTCEGKTVLQIDFAVGLV